MYKRRTRLVFSILFTLLMGVFPQVCRAGKLEPLGEVPVNPKNAQTPEKVELGKKLFFDRRLSGDATMSCATCHVPELAFTDGQAIALSYPTTKNWRNTPTLLNAAFHKYFMHDGRTVSLEQQAIFPIMSPFEMNQSLSFLEEEIRSVPEYVAAFEKVFGTKEISRGRIAMAIASFERTLIPRNSPLDRYLQGDKKALSSEARKGLKIFKGKGKCDKCHYGMNLSDGGFHALGVPEPEELQNDPRVAATRRFVAKLSHTEDFKELKEDPGRFLMTRNKDDWKAFKTPTLREITKTGPYMHNGAFKTLDEVIDFFDRGGGAGNTALKSLGLTAEAKAYLKAFLVEALSGDEIKVTPPEIP